MVEPVAKRPSAAWWRQLPLRGRVGLTLLPVVFLIVVVSPTRWGPIAFVLLLVGNLLAGALADRRYLRQAADRPAEDP
jgi:hypothetical protein